MKSFKTFTLLSKSIKWRYRLLLLLPLFFVGSALISSEQGRLRYSEDKIKCLYNTSTRQIFELSGNWQMSSDELNWETVSLPATRDNKSKIVFKRKLSIDPTIANKYTWALNFLGIDDHIEVYLNEQLVGKYFGGMTPFSVKIPANLIHNKSNQLKLIVTPPDEFSQRIKEQNIYAKKVSIGVLREIFLVGTPQVWVKDVYYKTALSADNQRADINAKVTIASGQIANLLNDAYFKDSLGMKISGKVQVEVAATIRSKSTGLSVAESAPQSLTFENERANTLSMNFAIQYPQLWAPDSPNLYDINVRVSKAGRIIDEYSQPLGISSIKAVKNSDKNSLFYLNGSPFIIKGVDYIEDHVATGQSLSPYRMEQDIIAMKTLGVNLIRFKHTAPHPYFSYLCDKYGIFITAEVPIYNVPSQFFSVYEVQSRMKNIAERLTQNYDNHPSTFAFGIGEGIIEGSSQVANLQKELIKTIKYTSSKLVFKNVLIGSAFFSTEGIDFIGFKDSRKYLTLEQLNAKMPKLIELSAGKPLFINFGFPMQIGNSNGYTDPITMEAQRNYMMHIANLVNNYKLAGLVYWAFNDYQLNNPLMTVNNPQQDECSVGLFSRARHQRLTYSTLQVLYTDQDEQPILTAGSYSESTPIIYIIAGLFTAIALVAFTRRFKRFREYLLRAVLRPYNFYADIRDQRIISIGQTFLLAFVNSIAVGLFFSAMLYYLRSSEIAQQAIMTCLPIKSILPGFYKLIWQPEYMCLIIAALGLLTVFIISGIIRIFSLFVKSRIYYSDTITIVVWASTPLLLLLPISMVLIKVLALVPQLIIPIIILSIAIYLWVVFRIIKSTTVVFDVNPIFSYSIAGAFIGVIALLKILYLNSSNAIFSYLDYLYKYIMNI